MQTNNRPQYITQLNAFHSWLHTNYLPANAKLLWFMLIGLFNAAGWPESVQVSTAHLMSMLNTSTDSTALRARQKLIDAGLLIIEKGKKGQPSRYRMVWFGTSGQTETESENGSINESTNESIYESGNERESVRKTKEKTREKTTANHTSYYKEKEKEKDKDEKRETIARVPAELRDVWRAYTQMRARMRKPLADAAAALVLDTLQNMAPGRPDVQKQILAQSVMNGWAGVYSLKEEALRPPASYDIGEMERKLLYGKIEYRKN